MIRLPIQNNKYAIEFNDESGELTLYRLGEVWENFPKYSNMLISIMYELIDARDLLSDIQFDFDPCKRQGPPCGPEMLERIINHAKEYGYDPRYVNGRRNK